MYQKFYVCNPVMICNVCEILCRTLSLNVLCCLKLNKHTMQTYCIWIRLSKKDSSNFVAYFAKLLQSSPNSRNICCTLALQKAYLGRLQNNEYRARSKGNRGTCGIAINVNRATSKLTGRGWRHGSLGSGATLKSS